MRNIIGSLLLLPDMEPPTPLISQSDHRVQTPLFMLDSSGLELLRDAPRLSNVLICDPADPRGAATLVINRKTREISESRKKNLIFK